MHAFVERDSPGVTVVETWDTLGMRPTQSHDTVLDDVFVPDARIGARRPGRRRHRSVPRGHDDVGRCRSSPPCTSASPSGRSRWPCRGARRKTSIAIERGAYAYNPMVQHQVAEMYLELDAAQATVDRFVDDWVAGADHGDAWVPKVYSMKWRAVEAAKRVVDIALDVAGGAGMFRGNELERLYRDVRCGGFHPGNDAITHEMVGKAVLGILAEQPRW